MNKRISRSLLLTCVALTGLVSAQMCLADDIPRPELGCRLLDSDGTPIDRADLSFQQRIAVGRCMNMAERDKEVETKQMKSQRQNIENAKIMRRSENQLAISGFRSPWRPSGSPHTVPGIP
jgi:hypothetical protein